MTNQDNRSKAAENLRQKAEALARERTARTQEYKVPLSPEEIQKTLHELRVHQIELEMQNEELRTAQVQIEAGRTRYFELYDLAPVGYCTLSEQGLILEANLTAATLLGVTRSTLVKQPISHFILKDDQDIYYLHRKQLFEKGEPQECELRLVKPDCAFFWAHLTATAAQAEDGAPVCRVVVGDITERKRAEDEIQKQLTEKETLLREVHHRVKNNIANIEGLLSLQASSTAYPEVKAALHDALSRVQSIRILYDKLLVSKDLREISMKNYIEDLIDSLHVVFVGKNNIIIEKQISEFRIISKQAITIGIIINELLTNVFKYAFKERDNGTVSISIEKAINKVTLIIHDNGIGIDERIMENESPGFGLTIVKMLVEQLYGTYIIVNDNGTKCVIKFEL